MSHYHRFWLSIFYVVQKEKLHTMPLLKPHLMKYTSRTYHTCSGIKRLGGYDYS